MSGNGYIRPYNAAPRGGPTVVWTVGDSITHGAEYVSPGVYNYFGGWRCPLFQAMVALGANPNFVGAILNSSESPPVTCAGTAHNGNNGSSATQWRDSFFQSYYTSLFTGGTPLYPVPDWILISLGTNDANDAATGVTIGQIADLAALNQPFANILVSNVIPRGGPGDPNNNLVNPSIAAEIAARRARGMNVHLVDQALHMSSALTGDTVHPNAAGYAIMGEVWTETAELLIQ